MQLITNPTAMRAAMAEARASGKKIVLVPTMGALHEGHLSLVKLARQHGQFVVVSVFVNPLQFGANEDFNKYPRNMGVDARLLTDSGVDLLFAPEVAGVYPEGTEVLKESAGPVGMTFEGQARPGHFDGMLTVVSRLLDLVQPDVAVFGKKDAQQLFLIRRMVASQISTGRRSPLKIVQAPTVRDQSGLALSSRNRFLAPENIPAAQSLSAALQAGALAAQSGAPTAQVLTQAKSQIHPEAKLEYLELVDPTSFSPVDPNYLGEALLIVAAQVGPVRLIDNIEVQLERKQ